MKSLYLAVFLFCCLVYAAYTQQTGPDSLWRVISSLPDNSEKADTYTRLARFYIFKNEDSAFFYSDKAVQLGQSISYPVAEAEGYHIKCLLYNRKDMFKESLPLVARYMDLIEPLNDTARLAKGYYNLGNIYTGLLNYEKALGYYRKSLGLYSAIDDALGILGNGNALGTLFLRFTVYDSAVYYYLLAADKCEKSGMEVHLCTIFDNVSSLYVELQQYDLARKYALRGIELGEKFNHEADIANCLTTLGRIASDEGKPDEAMDYYLRARQIYEDNNDLVALANIYTNIGVLQIDMQQYPESLGSFEKALKVYKEADYPRGIMVVLGNKAVVMHDLGKFREAIALHEEVIRMCGQYDAPDYKLDALDNVSWCYRKLGDFEKAFDYHIRYTDSKDSIFDIEKTKVINDLTLKYEKQKDQAQILELEKANLEKDLYLRKRTSQRNAYFYTGLAILAIASFLILFFRQRAIKDRIIATQRINQLEEEKKLMAAKFLVEGQEEERKRIARELHDGLGVLLSTTRMQFSSIHDTSPENKPIIARAAQLLEQAAGDVRKISHNMMPGLLTRLGLLEALKDLVENLNNSGSIRAEIDMADDIPRLPENQEIMLYRIIQEMVNNTLKHANARQMLIRIQNLRNHLLIEYSDNGKGFDVERTLENQTIGLKSIQSRVSFLNGSLDIRSRPGEGVQYTVRLPLFVNLS